MILLLVIWLTFFFVVLGWLAWCIMANNNTPEGWAPDDADHDPPDQEEADDDEDCKPMNLLRMREEFLE